MLPRTRPKRPWLPWARAGITLAVLGVAAIACVATAVAGDDGFLRVTVEDDGPGLPPDQRETVLRRGARLDESAPGSGLGLSIVDELAKAYGGSVQLGESVLGGLKVELRLPQAES